MSRSSGILAGLDRGEVDSLGVEAAEDGRLSWRQRVRLRDVMAGSLYTIVGRCGERGVGAWRQATPQEETEPMGLWGCTWTADPICSSEADRGFRPGPRKTCHNHP